MLDEIDALLVIDVQAGMFADPAMQPHDGAAVVEWIAVLIGRARARGVRVIFVQHDGAAVDGLAADGPGFALHPAIVPLAGDGHTTFGNEVLSGADVVRHHHATLGAGFARVVAAEAL